MKEKWRTRRTLRIGTRSRRVDWDGLDMLKEKMIMTVSNVVWHGRMKELDIVCLFGV